MTAALAINGFGRIGRSVLRAAYEGERTDVKIIALNDLAPIGTLAHLLKYDSVHGRFPGTVEEHADGLIVNGDLIRVTEMTDPAALPWSDVDVVCEATGVFRTFEKAEQIRRSGAGKVLISAPGKNVDKTIVYGVNHDTLDGKDMIVSNASCTTNCLAPLAKVLDDSFGIETGYMTTVHAYTSDQPSHDRPHEDLYRGRAASLSMVPTSTGAASAISLVLPHLEGRLAGSAIRVPTPNVSLVDLCIMPKTKVDRDAVNDALQAAAEGPMAGVLDVTEDLCVSIDFNHCAASSTVALPETAVTKGGMIRVVSWYDNEWGFSNRMLDTAALMASL
ncbi:MAG: type I glyceraldehyde-3-phosphate dehydrogenase [Pseudomonadota bacterium]